MVAVSRFLLMQGRRRSGQFIMKKIFDRENPAFQVFILISSIFTLYSFILSAPFKTLDDQASIYANPDIQDIKHFPRIFSKSFFGDDRFYYRPLVSLSFALEKHFFGFNAFFFNLTNIILHSLTAIIILCFMRSIFQGTFISFWVAFLFAIHPVYVEAVANIAGRSILLCAFFEWSALMFLALSMQRKKPGYYIVSMLSFALALLSKESSAVFPAIAFAYAFFFFPERSWVARTRKSLKAAFPFGIALLGYLLIRFTLDISSVSSVRDAKDYLCGILTFARAMIMYARVLLVPFDLYFDRICPVLYDLLSLESLATMLFWLSFVFILWKARHHLSAAVKFFILFVFIRFLPLSQLIPIRSQAGYICVPDHFLYVPSVGFFVCLIFLARTMVSQLVASKHLTRSWARSLIGLWMIFLAGTTIEQNIYATHEIALFSRSVSFRPEHVRLNIALGLRYVFEKKFAQAEPYFRNALAYEPTNTRARVSLATVLLDQGKLWEGLSEFEKVTDAENFQDLVDRNKNLAYRLLIKKYSAMIKGENTPADVHYSLGVVYAKQGDFQQAISYFQETLARDPRHRNAHENLCNSFWAAGDETRAQDCFQEINTQ